MTNEKARPIQQGKLCNDGESQSEVRRAIMAAIQIRKQQMSQCISKEKRHCSSNLKLSELRAETVGRTFLYVSIYTLVTNNVTLELKLCILRTVGIWLNNDPSRIASLVLKRIMDCVGSAVGVCRIRSNLGHGRHRVA